MLFRSAENRGGAMNGFMGMGMAQQAGGAGIQNLYAMGQERQQAAAAAAEPSATGWVCSCKTVNKGKFCYECGKAKPAGVPQYKCDKCGWEPEDPEKPPKFCPECGDPFDDGDIY